MKSLDGIGIVSLISSTASDQHLAEKTNRQGRRARLSGLSSKVREAVNQHYERFTLNIQDVMRHERSALLGESLIVAPISRLTLLPYAAVTDPDVLVRTPQYIRMQHPVTVQSLANRARTSAFIQTCPSLKYNFLWVHADNDSYRDDYKTFLKQVHKVSEELPSFIAADHLYNRERAREVQTPWIRLVLASGPINSSHGAGYEKSRTNNRLGAHGRDHKMDEITLMKLCGMPSPRKNQPLTAEMRFHVQKIAALYGMPCNEIERNIMELMQVAAFDSNTA